MKGQDVVASIPTLNGLKQGCPLSMHLLALFIEPLIVALENQIKGVPIFNETIKTRVFVDDMTIFVSSDRDTVESRRILKNFCCWTGTKINEKKSGILGMGSWRRKQE